MNKVNLSDKSNINVEYLWYKRVLFYSFNDALSANSVTNTSFSQLPVMIYSVRSLLRIYNSENYSQRTSLTQHLRLVHISVTHAWTCM